MKAIKELGQHFLKDPALAGEIADFAELKAGDRVWEIGPGQGILTAALLQRGARVSAFELDKRMQEVLNKRFPADNLELVMADILQVDWAARLAQYPSPIKLVANIPYQISSPLLYLLESYHQHFERIVMMLQKEVVERLCSPPGKKSYGQLTLRLGLKYNSRIVMRLKPEDFDPPPQVDSAVILMTPRPDAPELIAPDVFYALIKAAFAHKRKTLRNNLIAHLGKAKTQVLEAQSGIDFSQRAECLYEADFIRLSELVAAL